MRPGAARAESVSLRTRLGRRPSVISLAAPASNDDAAEKPSEAATAGVPPQEEGKLPGGAGDWSAGPAPKPDGGAGSRFYTQRRVIIGNSSKYIPPGALARELPRVGGP